MEEPPQIPSQESSEYIPNQEAILLEMGRYCGNLTPERERHDEKGIYLLEAWGPVQENGQRPLYIYQRSLVTRIFRVWYKGDDFYKGGNEGDLAEYNPETKNWVHK